MKRGRLLLVSIALVLLPATALAQPFCFGVTAAGTSVGTLVLQLGPTSGQFTGLIGEFINTQAFCGFAENAELTGSFRLTGGGANALVGAQIAGTTNCLPAVLQALIAVNPLTLSGNGTFDVPSQGDFTNVTLAPLQACPALAAPEEE